MTQFIFTKNALLQLKPATKQYQVSDLKIPGLKLRVSPGGSKVFIVYKKLLGCPQRVSIGPFPALTIDQARNLAVGHLHKFAQGITPNSEKKALRKEKTFRELYEIYYQEHALPHTKRPEDNKASIEVHIMPYWGAKKLSTFELDIVNKRYLKIGEKVGKRSGGPAIANRVLDIVSAVFTFGLQRGYLIGQNPCSGVRRFKKRSRDRFLSKDELTKFFEVLKKEELQYQDLFMLAILVGARKKTLLKMKFEEIDFDNHRWRLPEVKNKNNEVNVFMLTDAALNILERRKQSNSQLKTPSEFVFPGSGKHGHMVDPRKAFNRIKESIEANDLTIHDLRRTLGSYMTITGASLPIIGKALNHKSPQSTMIYARLSNDPVMAALNNATNCMIGNKLEEKLRRPFQVQHYRQLEVSFSSRLANYCPDYTH